MAGLNDNREDLYDVNGSYVGQGGQGMVTRPGVDPSGGAHQQVVQTGIQKMEDDVAQVQNGVTDVSAPKSVLSGWNYAKRGAIQPAQAQPVQSVQQVADGGNVDMVVTPPTDTKQANSVTTPSVGSTAKSPALQELRQRQKAEIEAENAKKAEEAVKREEADKSLANGGHQPAVTETQLQTERNTNPQSSETGSEQNAPNGNTATTTPEGVAVKTESSLNTTKPTVSENEYNAALGRLRDARDKGGLGDLSDKLTVFDYEHPERTLPEMPALEEFTESQPPKLKDIDDSYRTAYAIMEQRIKAAGDDPESKAKRSKARRAQTLVAALGDLLQAAANMWGAAGGATSAKLSSVTAGVGRRHATEDAGELKREAQRAKDLEQMVRRGEKLTDAENKKIMELWKAGENARKYNIGERNKAIIAKYNADLQDAKQYNAQIGRDRHQVQVQHDREVTDFNRHNYRSAEINQRTAGSIKVKRTAPAKASGSGKTSGRRKTNSNELE